MLMVKVPHEDSCDTLSLRSLRASSLSIKGSLVTLVRMASIVSTVGEGWEAPGDVAGTVMVDDVGAWVVLLVAVQGDVIYKTIYKPIKNG